MSIQEFIDPKSQLTPGVAGGMVIAMGLPLATQFDLSFNWVALGVSALLALTIVIAMKGVGLLSRLVYGLLNTMIIFAMSMGIGSGISEEPTPPDLTELTELMAQLEQGDMPRASAEPLVGSSASVPRLNPRPSSERPEIRKRLDLDRLKAYQQQREAYDKRWSW